MKKMFTSLVLSLLMAAPALCETSVWIASTDSSVMYIGGTIHFLRKADLPLPPEFEQAYKASEMLVCETYFDQLNSPETQQVLMTKSVYSDGRTLKQVLSDEAYKKLEECCTERGFALTSMNQLKPSVVMLTLLSSELQKLGVDQMGIDAYFYGKAMDDKKPIQVLETIEEQLEVITSMGDGNESALVLYSIEEMKKIGENFEKLVKTWKIGDEANMYELLLKDIKQDFPKLFKMLFVDRNMNWLPKIEECLITPETEFILVGTGHLIGEEGVIAQLKKLGYKVKKFK
jgi:hypothetical protein